MGFLCNISAFFANLLFSGIILDERNSLFRYFISCLSRL